MSGVGGGIDVFQLYPSTRIHAPPHVSDIGTIAAQIELPGLPQVRVATPIAAAPAQPSTVLEESFSAVASTLANAVESARHAVAAPVRRSSGADFQTPEQAEKGVAARRGAGQAGAGGRM
jgi:hypothetical protein